MALTQDQVKALTAPFRYEDHEFTRGFAYLTEQAVTRRLSQVDPSWEFTITETVRDTTNATVCARLTVCGVTRDGVGMQGIEYVSFTDKATGEKKVSTDALGNPRESGEARKGAATDALKRAARLFGIGLYILDAPKLRMASQDAWETKLDAGSEKAFRQFLSKIGADAPAPANPFADLPQHEPTPEQTAKATPNGWTMEAAQSLVTEAKHKNVSNEELLGVLGVARISEFQPGLSAARKLLADYVKARPAQPAAQEQVAF